MAEKGKKKKIKVTQWKGKPKLFAVIYNTNNHQTNIKIISKE